jgi:hypothetical protein
MTPGKTTCGLTSWIAPSAKIPAPKITPVQHKALS